MKRQKLDNGTASVPIYATHFDEEELAAETRRPKKKVAVMIGYSGTGYKGMQLAPDQKTIEGDLFKAFVAAGAISKANADDPKKSSFVRCARTDKGVHAAGNVISLKLIVEDDDIVERINNALAPQIRVWGYEKTTGSFSAYQLVDSRIYEYLIPTHSFLPPHPRSYLGRKCREWAERKSEVAEWEERQKEVEGYWEKVDREMIQPILDEYPENIRGVLEKALWLTAEREADKQVDSDARTSKQPRRPVLTKMTTDKETESNQDIVSGGVEFDTEPDGGAKVDTENVEKTPVHQPANDDAEVEGGVSFSPAEIPSNTTPAPLSGLSSMTKEERIARRKTIDEAVKRLRTAYISAKRSYRIPEKRRERLQAVLELYVGTNNFWNYTIQKPYSDPSAKRVIKSFVVNPTPVLIDGTEWLSLKVHGQSFMMHQIRKMVGMAALIVRCGCDPSRIHESYQSTNMSIPKAPSLGLLLERPVFDSYNKRAHHEFQKQPIDFNKFKDEMDAFKQKFIYERMYQDEERDNIFGNFFNHVDNFPSNTFLFVTSGGLDASLEADGPETGAAQDGDEDQIDWDQDGDRDGGARVHRARGGSEFDSEDEDGGIQLDNHGNEG